MSNVTEKRIASNGNLNEYDAINISSSRILTILAIIKVLEKLLNFFSLALNNNVTKANVIPAKSNNNKGQNFEMSPVVKNEIANPATANTAV
jgi:CRISPR/Cas system endoribonuclease Cas6 (RAMP superfamily)